MYHPSARSARRTAALVASLSLLVAMASPVAAVAPAGPDARISSNTYVRHDTPNPMADAGIAHCNNTATNPAADDITTDADIDSNDGGSRRQANEPFSIIDPTNPSQIAAGFNDYCLTDLAAGWMGLGFSTNGGSTWTNSIVPGYPQDTSTEGMASPLFGTHTDSGDPVAAFDNDGNLYVGGIAFNRLKPSNGDVWVATYSTNPSPSMPWDYQRTVIVGQGTPSEVIGGIFQDKIMLEVDRTGGATDGNVYVCWTRFTGAAGGHKAYFTRSIDGGATFSRPIAISGNKRVQGCDIAIEGDGDVYVSWRTFVKSAVDPDALGFARSTDGGATFGKSRIIRQIEPYFPFDSSRDCGDGAELCPTGFVFHRVPLEPRLAADQTGALPGVYLIYNEVDPGTLVPSTTSYSSASGGRVGRSVVYVLRTTNNGRTWSAPTPVDLSPADPGHQYFADIDAHAGVLAAVWHDSRSDPCYSVQLPIGNTPTATSCGTSIVDTYVASSTNGTTWSPGVKVSSVAHQPQYEMFGNRSLPFQGDYNWVSIGPSGTSAYVSWTDNRDVVPGPDPRETTQDGFDVHQCRTQNASGVWSADTCANAGGLNQNIYGRAVTLP
jgi:hypothetical protein